MYQNFAKKSVICVGTIVFLWLTVRFLLPIALPFLLGALLAVSAEPTARLLRNRAGLPPAAATGVAVSGVFLLFGALGNRNDAAVYEKIPFSMPVDLKKGVELRRVAILEDCPVKDALRFIERGSYLVLEVYSKTGELLFNLPQNLLAECFAAAQSPYEPISKLATKIKGEKVEKSA